jgi:hypothetical protein
MFFCHQMSVNVDTRLEKLAATMPPRPASSSGLLGGLGDYLYGGGRLGSGGRYPAG